MADLSLVRDVLDEQLVDAQGRRIGKADGIVCEMEDDAPPRVVAIEVGLPTLGDRLSPFIGRLLERFHRWMGLSGNGRVRVPFEGLEVGPTEIVVPIDGEVAGLFRWENFLRTHVVAHLPGGR